MKLRKTPVKHPVVSEAIFFTETSTDDYMYNHLIDLVGDSPLPDDISRYNKLKFMPSTALVSDRFVHTESTDELTLE